MDFLSTKRVIYAGRGDLFDFDDGYKVIFHYRVQTLDNGGAESGPAGNDSDSMCIDDSKLPYPKGYGKPMELIFGKKFRLPVWEVCLKSMRLDEMASFILPVKELIEYPFVSKQLRDISKKSLKTGRHDDDDHHGHGSSCMGLMAAAGGLGYPELDAWLKDPKPLKFTFHLIQVLRPEDYERESWTLNASEKMASLDCLRQAGNQFFKENHWSEACEKYCEALSRLDSLMLAEKPNDPEWKALDHQKVAFYANLAECKLRTQDFYAAIEAADEALKRDPENVKALFRRGKAHAGAWNFKAARNDYEHLRNLDPSMDKVVERELANLSVLENNAKKEEAEKFKNLFSS